MSLPDAAEARRISAQLATLEQQREQGNLPHEDTPFRLYRVRTGGFVRVLDQHPEPISQGMLDAIDAFIRRSTDSEELEEKEAAAEEEKEETRQDNDGEEADGAEQSTATQEQREDTHEESIAAGEDAATVVATAATDVHNDDVEKTQLYTSDDVEITPPWEAATITKTPPELLARNERVSEWLGKQSEVGEQTTELQMDGAQLNGHPVEQVENELLMPVDHPTLYEQWPPQLEERRKMWFVPRNSGRKASVIGAKHQPVVYWMHNTLRVMQGNFGLETAILLSRRLSAPLVVVSLIPSSIIYPVCHSTTASDAYARFSLVELYQQFLHAGVSFFGITAKENGAITASNDQHSFALKPNPLYELLDSLEPHAVITDAMFDSPSRNDLVRLARYLALNRSSCSWSLLSMDSTTCCPAYQLSMKLQGSFERGAAFASEEQFGAEYAPHAQPRHGTYVFSPLPRAGTQDPALNQRRSEMLSFVLQRLHLEEVNWHVVKAENSQSSTQMRRFSEGEGLQKLSQLLSGSDGQPAIQAELRGGGVLSLLPFIRHGTLFAGYVLRRITEAIASCPTPTTPQERKALAMRKVMRSRAVNHLGKERDYVLYLALWAATSGESSGSTQPDIASLSTSEIIASLKMSAARTSSLETYQKLLPSWTFSAARIGDISNGQVPGAALYDPYEQESARTKDPYWNEIQKFLVEQQYLHPLLVVYWAYRLMTWNVSSRAAIATIDSLLSQCALGSDRSPDAVFIVWKQLFRLGSNNSTIKTGTETKTPNLGDLREFQRILEREIASQPQLQLRP
ncbi:hypothetical protein PC129_g11792 [Phytophthora cactorum]|uniref:Photolyase/cryptochrome alpha/beta domain-containing protein n=1 Tax=Phytophthora cactorum TaxID=29920 RepID=A0A329SI76_9STRA|nr:hypothetical protein Pcac1_g22009 [Phytophthora cactorum]KAG3217376.1 hypothetical protein PC129_g11792 [Phytophthora cactorum]KAG4243234.1 hypothetical protein PC116_g8870 [Phytophthora cactorum]RAW36494.1 hypothetical protein PC110_g7209 [Phytophthora cactorum]